ncbi:MULTISPECIES: type II CAAX endopeptidase family protein [Paenibacillus]|uniref:CPBP family intramembrane metalloprotease n=1 Tax=Paenibacillus alvei TaxID=44250 RepID=A0ABT4E433_PAEAL|nr:MULTISPECIES: type II CAAX endopeptidase family protein [Paenibacillus]EPY12459.1 hypothetical protein PAAL66ix_12127 [Paenibacillus alvei A6-6i-x]MCY9528493.1 CPBP family intramembrane metalloprotease [Paenibacillus alvei]
MFSNLHSHTKALIYTAIVFILAIGVSIVPNTNSLLYMLTPTVAAFIMLLFVTKDGRSRSGWAALGLRKYGFKWWLLCITVPAGIVALSYGFAWGVGALDIKVPPNYAGYDWSAFPFVVAIQFVSAVLISSLGEELGWRGYLLPLLVNSLGERKALFATGLIHGLWHIPIILLSSIYHQDQNPILACLFTVVSCLFLGPVIGYIRLRSSSVWTASIFHSAHNVMWSILRSLAVPASGMALYVAGDNSIVVILCYMLLTVWVMKHLCHHTNARSINT